MGIFFWGGSFFVDFLGFLYEKPTFLTFWTDFLSFPLGFFIWKTYFLYILDGFPVISLRFSLVFPGENPIFLTFWTDILSFP